MEQTYLDLLSPHNRSLPRFSAMAALILTQAEDLSEALISIPGTRSVETAEGVCLDMIGRCLGCSREVCLPNEDSPDSPVPVTLTDEQYRLLLRAWIHTLCWDGADKGIRDCLDDLFGSVRVLFDDPGDRSLHFTVPDAVSGIPRAMLLQGLLFPRSPGVSIREE